jgi:hypothetical protein
MSSCVFIARKNQSPAAGPPEKLEFTGADITVAKLRSTLAQLRRLDPSEIELSFAGSILTDQHPPVPRQSTVEVRRKPPAVQTHTQRGLAAQTAAWAKGSARHPVAPAVPLSQQRKPSFGLGTFQGPGSATHAYADREAQSGCEPSAPRLPAPPQPQTKFPIRLPSETQQYVQYDSNNLPPPPKEFACSLCSGWIADAHILRCCGISVCKACVDDARFRNCRDCRAPLPGGGSAACLSNRNLQAIILQTQRQTVASATAAHERFADDSPANDTPCSPNVGAPAPVDPDDLYTLLGVPSHSTQPEIAKAYRALALQLHPDKQADSVDPQKTALFVKVSAAYELLSDREARRRYDHNKMVHSMRAKRQRR